MTSPNYASFLPYTRNDSGRRVYIDPSLIVEFNECIDPSTDSGRAIANQIQADLSSQSGGLTSGTSTEEPNSFYMDFGDYSGQAVRVFYRIFQDAAGGEAKGAGVYIYKIRRFSHNRSSVQSGLFHMKHAGSGWASSKVNSGELNCKVLRIGSMLDQQRDLITVDRLATRMLSASNEGNYKTDFNLYHSPLAVIENGVRFETPESRLKVISPKELADVISKTNALGEWSGKQYDSYSVYVYGDASKLLKEALQILSLSGVMLKKFSFILIAPYTPASVIQKLASSCGASVTVDNRMTSEFSMRYQMLDGLSVSEDNVGALKKYNSLIESTDGVTFLDLWSGMKSILAVKSA